MGKSAADAADMWLARGAIVAVVMLQIAMVHNFALGSRWFAPALEIALLGPIMWLSIRNKRISAQRHGEPRWLEELERHRQRILILGLSLASVVSVANATALIALVRALLQTGGGREGATLLLDAANIWSTNVIVFALWYWEIDRGGPGRYVVAQPRPSDFVFPQMTVPADHPAANRSPVFVDYLFLSFTTSTAFSPTDTLPLTPRMKALMMLEASISLVTIALVAARAVNILR